MTLYCVCSVCTIAPPSRAQASFASAEKWGDAQWRKRWCRCEDTRGQRWRGETNDILARRCRDIRGEHDEVMRHLRERFLALP